MINHHKDIINKKIKDYGLLTHYLIQIIKIYKEVQYLDSMFLSLSNKILSNHNANIEHNTEVMEYTEKFLKNLVDGKSIKYKQPNNYAPNTAEIDLCREQMRKITAREKELFELLESFFIKTQQIAKEVDDNDIIPLLKMASPNKPNNKLLVGSYTRNDFGNLTRLLFGDILPKVCEHCGSTEKLHIHHKRYALPIIQDDLMRLCQNCHLVLHRELRRRKKNNS